MTILYSGPAQAAIPPRPEVSKEVKAWVRKGNRKAPVLFSSEPLVVQPARTPEGPALFYTIIYETKGKVRIGSVRDYMHTRYGIDCHGASDSPDIMYLWQSGAGSVTKAQWEAMRAYMQGQNELPPFDFATLKGLQY